MTPAQTIARRIVLGLLRRMTAGRLELVEPDGQVHVLGPGAPPSALIHVRDPRAWTELLRGSRGLASSYVAGHWESSDPTAVVRVAARNAPALDAMRRRLTLVREPYQRLRGVGGSATRSQSREDIRRHYDLGNDLFALMLDETLMYSAAYFQTPDTSLHEASIAKLELVCDKLDLHADDHVIEIGAGWGGFALHAATTRGCRVTTTTISAEQHAHATELVARAGLGDRVTVLASDYRDLSGKYTALVSLEMIEAVGWKHFGTFLGKCSDLLEPDGRMLLQAITIDDRAYAVEKASKSFIRTSIFPNGCLPSQQVIADQLARHTDLRMVHHEDLTDHYVTTLQRWRHNIQTHADRLTELGYDERFQRLWRIYLCYSEAGFAERRIAVAQTLLAKPHWTRRVPVDPRRRTRRRAHRVVGRAGRRDQQADGQLKPDNAPRLQPGHRPPRRPVARLTPPPPAPDEHRECTRRQSHRGRAGTRPPPADSLAIDDAQERKVETAASQRAEHPAATLAGARLTAVRGIGTRVCLTTPEWYPSFNECRSTSCIDVVQLDGPEP